MYKGDVQMTAYYAYYYSRNGIAGKQEQKMFHKKFFYVLS